MYLQIMYSELKNLHQVHTIQNIYGFQNELHTTSSHYKYVRAGDGRTGVSAPRIPHVLILIVEEQQSSSTTARIQSNPSSPIHTFYVEKGEICEKKGELFAARGNERLHPDGGKTNRNTCATNNAKSILVASLRTAPRFENQQDIWGHGSAARHLHGHMAQIPCDCH